MIQILKAKRRIFSKLMTLFITLGLDINVDYLNNGDYRISLYDDHKWLQIIIGNKIVLSLCADNYDTSFVIADFSQVPYQKLESLVKHTVYMISDLLYKWRSDRFSDVLTSELLFGCKYDYIFTP